MAFSRPAAILSKAADVWAGLVLALGFDEHFMLDLAVDALGCIGAPADGAHATLKRHVVVDSLHVAGDAHDNPVYF